MLSKDRTYETAREAYRQKMSIFPKLKYKVKMIAGDYYYEEMSE